MQKINKMLGTASSSKVAASMRLTRLLLLGCLAQEAALVARQPLRQRPATGARTARLEQAMHGSPWEEKHLWDDLTNVWRRSGHPVLARHSSSCASPEHAAAVAGNLDHPQTRL